VALNTPTNAADATIVSAGLLAGFAKSNKVSQVTNTAYTGEILGKGSTVKIVSVNDITLVDYTPGQTVLSPENVSDAALMLTVDQAKAFAFQVDDTAAAMGAGDYLNAAATRAGQQFAETIDSYLAGVISAGAGVTIGGTTGVALASPADAYKLMIDIRTKLAGFGQDWSVIVPSSVYGLLLQDPRFVGTGFNAQFNGQVGTVVGGTVIESNVRPNEILAVAGADSVASVTAVNKVERYRPESSFSDAVKGLVVFGAKVIRANAVVKVTIKP
jgi:hypothetical protein